MKRINTLSAFALLTLFFLVSCRSPSSRHNWTVKEPLADPVLWDQIISSINFSNTPLSEAVQQLEQQAHGVSIGYTPSSYENGPETSRINFTAENISLRKALRILAFVSGHAVFYSGGNAVFVPSSQRDDCIVPLRIYGRCVDEETDRPIRKINIKRVKYEGMGDRRLANTIVPVRTDILGHFDINVPVVGEAFSYKLDDYSPGETYPYDQVLILEVSAHGYTPQTHEIPIADRKNEYLLDIRLKASSNPSDTRK